MDEMSIRLSTLVRRTIPAVLAAATALNPAVVAAAPTGTSGGTLVPLRGILRSCDYAPIPPGASVNNATTAAVIRVNGGTVAADVQLSEPSTPGAHFDVILIQAPRASTSPCTSAGPGVAVSGLDIDGVGQGAATVQDSIHSGTTGVWVFVRRASPYSQTPAEFYTSDFITPV
jgi:hypothetical protein